MYTKKEMIAGLKRQLSLDFNCRPDDFDLSDNVITVSSKNKGRREYIKGTFFLSMVTLGQNAVIMADKRLHPWLEDFVRDKKGIWLFEHEHLMSVEKELSKYGKRLCQTHHMFLPNAEPLDIKPDFEVRWFEESDIKQFYGNANYPNAFCKEYDPDRPDVLAVAAVIDGEIAGMAGCSADTETMWQIGIDVLPEYRGRGVGAALVGLLKDEVFKRGYIPFYGTSLSNLHSWKIALKCGFYPAWVEIETVEE